MSNRTRGQTLANTMGGMIRSPDGVACAPDCGARRFTGNVEHGIHVPTCRPSQRIPSRARAGASQSQNRFVFCGWGCTFADPMHYPHSPRPGLTLWAAFLTLESVLRLADCQSRGGFPEATIARFFVCAPVGAAGGVRSEER